jgi:hypothetical protein
LTVAFRPAVRAGPSISPKSEDDDMALIGPGAEAPDFTLDSHLDQEISLSDYRGKKNVLLVSYPLDFTPT